MNPVELLAPETPVHNQDALMSTRKVEDITIDEQIACVQRELKHRESVYRRLIEKDHMTREDANQEYLRMKAVLRTLKEQQPNLFNQ